MEKVCCLNCGDEFPEGQVPDPPICEACAGLVVSDGEVTAFNCKSCGDVFVAPIGEPVPELCPECRAIEDRGGRATTARAGQRCQRCALEETPFAIPGWLCPKCHGEDQDKIANMHVKLKQFVSVVDGLTERNAELITERDDALRLKEEAMHRLSKAHDKVMGLVENSPACPRRQNQLGEHFDKWLSRVAPDVKMDQVPGKLISRYFNECGVNAATLCGIANVGVDDGVYDMTGLSRRG